MSKLKLAFFLFILLAGSIVLWMWGVVVFGRQPLPEVVKREEPVKKEERLEVPGPEVPGKRKEAPVSPEIVMPEEEPILVRAFKVRMADFQDVLPAMGTVKGTEEIELRFEINGVVSAVNFREGDRVKKGDLIASLDQKDAILRLEYARSKLTTAQNNHLTAQKKLEVYEGLYEAGVIIKPKLEEIRLEAESARLQVNTAKVEVELGKSELKKTSLFAPREGVIGERNVEVGEYVTPNTRVASLIKIDEVFVEVGIIEKDIDKIKLGQRAVVTVDTYPDMNFRGKIENIFSVVEGKSRTLTTRIKIPNPQGLLLPGMFARVGMYLVELKNAVIIPSASLIRTSPEVTVVPVVLPGIYALEEVERGIQPGVVELREITLGYTSPDFVQITSGLNRGELVITEAQGELKEAAKVRVAGVEELTF